MDIRRYLFLYKMHASRLRNVFNIVAEISISLASLGSLFILLYQFGYSLSPQTTLRLSEYHNHLLLLFFVGISLRYIVQFDKIIRERMLFTDLTIYFLLIGSIFSKIFFTKVMADSLPYLDFFSNRWFTYGLLAVLTIIHSSRQVFTVIQHRIRPSLLFIFSFAFVILTGTGLLMLPNATIHGIHFVDALFTATTSVCVTGLTTVDVATQFTAAGHIIILLLIQVGGIGVMTFTSFFALSFMGETSINSQLILKDMLSEERLGGLFKVVINILFVTLFIEAIGAYLIFQSVSGTLPGGTSEELFYAVFHSVSGFCNAGISTLSGNLNDPLVQTNYWLRIIISGLIIFGGLGFPILFNYIKLLRHVVINSFNIVIGKQKHYIHTPHIINAHSYIVITSTIVLILVGSLSYLFFEYNNTLAGLPTEGKLATALLGGVTPRTAGFNPTNIGMLSPTTLVIMLILMFIGAGPMSTGGGIKVTAMFVALAATFNIMRNKRDVEVRGRRITTYTIRRSLAVIVVYLTWLMLATIVLSWTEKGIPLFSLVFELVSALSTVGLSINLSPLLSETGKMVVIVSMFIGRIGVLTFFTSLMKEYKEQVYAYPKEHILM
ncbi:MAG: TrkH family potassium uptake protein [Macellibacteroides fermentans]|uniref:TrkH family potassium uptake protein n=1 Tax=Macellibacteroides fermentans TaxID=879969 RepID=UPI003AC5D840